MSFFLYRKFSSNTRDHPILLQAVWTMRWPHIIRFDLPLYMKSSPYQTQLLSFSISFFYSIKTHQILECDEAAIDQAYSGVVKCFKWKKTIQLFAGSRIYLANQGTHKGDFSRHAQQELLIFSYILELLVPLLMLLVNLLITIRCSESCVYQRKQYVLHHAHHATNIIFMNSQYKLQIKRCAQATSIAVWYFPEKL